jgi:hypothetical protein
VGEEDRGEEGRMTHSRILIIEWKQMRVLSSRRERSASRISAPEREKSKKKREKQPTHLTFTLNNVVLLNTAVIFGNNVPLTVV